jgi:flagellar basal-body rod modification protein FlgD
MESTEFTNQLVQFSNVEQNIKTNGYLEQLLSTQALNLTALGVSFIGKNVEVGGDTFLMDGVNGAALSYGLPAPATSGNVSITNENGDVVYTSAAELSAGSHEFTWNGNDLNGQPVPAGKYTIRVGALNEEGGSLNVSTFVPGHVSGLESAGDGSLLLNISGEKIPLSEVRKIFE